jgi:hypothetical protein
MHLNVGWNIRVHGQGNARHVLRQPAQTGGTGWAPHNQACSDPAPVELLSL